MTQIQAAKVYEALASYLHGAYGFVERPKRKSVLMWVFALFLYPFNRRFMTDYTTTVFGRVYYPDDYVQNSPSEAWRTLAHEGRHLHDAHNNEPWFSLSYLFPQGLALLSLLALLAIPFSNWWLLSLASLLALAPWPAPWRTRWERNGYQASIIVDIMRGWDVEASWYVNYMIDHFSGWGYYRMTWSRVVAAQRVLADIQTAKALLAGSQLDPYYTPLIATLRSAGV